MLLMFYLLWDFLKSINQLWLKLATPVYLYTDLLSLCVVSYQIVPTAKTEDHGTNASMSETV